MDYANIKEKRVQLIHGDCLEKMKGIPDKSIDLILTDPPYGIGVTKMKLGNAKMQTFHRGDWDNTTPERIYWDEMFRISKNQMIFGAEHLCHYLPISRGWVFWDKNNGASSFADGELIWTSFNYPLRIKKVHWVGSAPKWEDTQGKVHPTQKPVKLIQALLDYYSDRTKQSSFTVLDPFMGSGSTGIACLNTKRNFIGIEKDDKYFEIAKKRIDEAQNANA